MRHSESIDKISPALLAAQKETLPVKKTATNPFYGSDYAPLDEILTVLMPIYNKHGLVIMQDISPEGSISTFILHESGQWIQQDGLCMPLDKQTPQGAGIAVTYGRRYSLKAMVGLADEDDDGNGVEGTVGKKKNNKPVESGYKLDNDNAPARDTYKSWQKTMSKEEIRETFGYWKPNGSGFDWYSIVIQEVE